MSVINLNSNEIRNSGFLRITSIIAPNGPLPISRSTFFLWIQSGRWPKPVKLGKRISAWRVEDVRAALAQLSKEA